MGGERSAAVGNAVVYFEVGGPDNEPLTGFYRELFGWGIQRVGEGVNYSLIDTNGGKGVNGGLGKSGTGDPWATFYVATPDIQATLDKAASLGAKTVVPVTEIPGFGTFAMFDDPDGLLIGLTQVSGSQEGAPGPSSGEGAPVDWFEVLGSDAERTQGFYREIFGWTVNPGAQGYGLVDTGAGARHPGRDRRGRAGGLGDGLRARARRRADDGQGRAARRDAGLRADGGRRPHADRGLPRPRRERVRRLPPRGPLTTEAAGRVRARRRQGTWTAAR